MPTRILLAGDHILLRQAVREHLDRKGGGAGVVVSEAGDGVEIMDMLTRHCPDVVILQYKMHGLGRLSKFCNEICRQCTTTRILVITGYSEEEAALEAATGRVHGYLTNRAPLTELSEAIDTLMAGGLWLDPRLPRGLFQMFLNGADNGRAKLRRLSRQELRILSLLAQDKSNKEISSELHISKKTVKNHVTHVLGKLGVRNRQEARRYFLGEDRGPQAASS